jgi:hypothetical protein
MTTQVTKTPSRTVPIAETMSSIGRGFPDKLVIFKIPASSYWWVRYYTQKKILKKSTKTENKKTAIEFAKKFYEDILLRERNLLPLGSSPIFEKVARELLIEQGQLIERGERSDKLNINDKQKLEDTNVININDLFKKKDVLVNSTDKSKLYDKYMKIVYNINTRKTKNSHIPKICLKCKIEKTIHISDGYLICTSCGDSEPILLETDKVNFKDSNIELKACAYKRTNHLSEILNQFQAKESTEIDKQIYEQIKNELHIQRIYDYNTLDHKIIKKILKKLKLNKYYEHTHHIINNLNGIPPPTISREQEENIKKMFKDIQKPFTIYRPKKRKNFLNYNYIIHKICELLEYDDFLTHFPLLKSRINLEEQDLVWEKICKYKNYEFIPSI